jgi:Mce-associated membrane protein
MSQPEVARRRFRLPPAVGRFFRSSWFPWSLFVLALGLAVLFAVLWSGQRADDRRREEVEAAARGFLLALTNFAPDTIDQDVEEIRSFAVGQFADEVGETFSPEQVAAIRENQATSVGRVRNLFVQNLEEDTATVFGVVDETVANSSSPTPRSDVLRLEIGLIETSEAWKVDRVEILQSPGGSLVAPTPS